MFSCFCADASLHAWAEGVLGHTIEDLRANTISNLTIFLACADQARALLGS